MRVCSSAAGPHCVACATQGVQHTPSSRSSKLHVLNTKSKAYRLHQGSTPPAPSIHVHPDPDCCFCQSSMTCTLTCAACRKCLTHPILEVASAPAVNLLPERLYNNCQVLVKLQHLQLLQLLLLLLLLLCCRGVAAATRSGSEVLRAVWVYRWGSNSYSSCPADTSVAHRPSMPSTSTVCWRHTAGRHRRSNAP
jgi:hypothetical protein